MALKEKTLKEKFQIFAFALGALSYINPMDKSLRHKYINYKNTSPAIYALWHGSLFGFLSFRGNERKKVNLLISPSNDGEMIAQVSRSIGFGIIRGTFNRRASQALRELIRKLRNNENVTYTVDGPRGPIGEVKTPVIKLAQATGVPIIPMVPVTNDRFEFSSWDKFQVPYFFAKVLTIFGDPIFVPKDSTDEQIEEYRKQLEDTLIELNAKGKELVTKWHQL